MVFSGGLRSFGLSCLGGVGGFALAKVIYPDVTYQENPQAIKVPILYSLISKSLIKFRRFSKIKFSNME